VVGFVLGDRWCGIDLDDVRNPDTGEITPEAAALVERVGTYAEVSPSGTGLKLFGRGKWTGKKHRYPFPGGGELEVYDSGRYFTVTGLPTGDRPVADVTAALAELDGPEEPKPNTTGPKKSNPESTSEEVNTDSTTDDELIARMTAAANGAVPRPVERRVRRRPVGQRGRPLAVFAHRNFGPVRTRYASTGCSGARNCFATSGRVARRTDVRAVDDREGASRTARSITPTG